MSSSSVESIKSKIANDQSFSIKRLNVLKVKTVLGTSLATCH